MRDFPIKWLPLKMTYREEKEYRRDEDDVEKFYTFSKYIVYFLRNQELCQMAGLDRSLLHAS